jgi:hypothetical protein
MLAAVSGLGYLLSTLLKLENSLGYFLPLPVIIASCRSGAGAGWRTMSATAFLLVGAARGRGWPASGPATEQQLPACSGVPASQASCCGLVGWRVRSGGSGPWLPASG